METVVNVVFSKFTFGKGYIKQLVPSWQIPCNMVTPGDPSLWEEKELGLCTFLCVCVCVCACVCRCITTSSLTIRVWG